MIADRLPILAVCGWSGSGKTTLIEQLVRRLASGRLSVAVVKHDVHGFEVDRPGKDSDRFFRAGADVTLCGPGETFHRVHRAAHLPDDSPNWLEASRRHDLVLVEGFKHTPLPKVWLLGEREAQPPPEAEAVLDVVPRHVDRLAAVLPLVEAYLETQWRRTPLFGCVLIGGKSRRMGRPKHLLRTGAGITWLEHTISVLSPLCKGVVIAGPGDVPACLAGCPRLPDAPDAQGPMAGLLAAMRWAPWASWLLAACDMPYLSAAAVEWLLSTRRPDTWASLPRLPGDTGVEPLLAHYDFRARGTIESLVRRGEYSLSVLSRYARMSPAIVPESLAAAWRDVDR